MSNGGGAGPGQGAQRYRPDHRGIRPAGVEEKGKLLQDDGRRWRRARGLVLSLERLKIRKLEHGWMIPRGDLNTVISFD